MEVLFVTTMIADPIFDSGAGTVNRVDSIVKRRNQFPNIIAPSASGVAT